MFSAEGAVFAALHSGSAQTDSKDGAGFRGWLKAWQAETGHRLEL
jgi:hypothetical protein